MFVSPVEPSQAIADRLRQTITRHAQFAPRSLQTRIGLSEIGDPCARKIAYKITGTEKTNVSTDPWASISGTAIHAWLADCFGTDPNYLVEQKVEAATGLSGTVDLYDIEQGLVIDHKCVGATSMKKRLKEGMTKTQRVQLSMYALGLIKMGYQPKNIACAYYPLGGRLDNLHVVVEPFFIGTAMDAINRMETIEDSLQYVKVDEIPAEPSGLCSYCSWYLPNSTDLRVGCPGDMDAR